MAGNNQPILKRVSSPSITLEQQSIDKLVDLKNKIMGSESKPALQSILIDVEKTPEQNILTPELLALIDSKKTTKPFDPKNYFG